jgi:hypothetical protein
LIFLTDVLEFVRHAKTLLLAKSDTHSTPLPSL